MGTIRGDFSMSMQENIVHTSDSVENALVEINRFFDQDEIIDYSLLHHSVVYATNEF
jgi:nucleoside-diphosphate kinase